MAVTKRTRYACRDCNAGKASSAPDAALTAEEGGSGE